MNPVRGVAARFGPASPMYAGGLGGAGCSGVGLWATAWVEQGSAAFPLLRETGPCLGRDPSSSGPHTRGMRTLGWSGTFHEVPWDKIADRFRAIEQTHPGFSPMVDIVTSVIETGADQQLAGLTSMTDLIVVPRPVPEPPMDQVVVRWQWDFVQIEHVAHTGRNDKIRRPAEEAVRLFWRFMIEKYGVHPSPTGAEVDVVRRYG